MSKVFISYSHDSVQHSERVLQLANALRSHGIDAELDQYNVRPPKGWPHWCEEQLRPENSEFVLLICTETYLRRVQDKVSADEGRGVFWEGAIIYDYIYDAKGNTRFIPILLPGCSADCIPIPIRNHTRYHIENFEFSDADYTKLYRELTNQPALTKPELGKIISLPTHGQTLAPLTPRAAQSHFPINPSAITKPATTTNVDIPLIQRRWFRNVLKCALIAAVVSFLGSLVEIPNSIMSWFINVRELSKREETTAKSDVPQAPKADKPHAEGKPTLGLKFIYTNAPALVIENKTGFLAQDIKWMVSVWNLDVPERDDPLPIPVGTFDWIRPNSASGPIMLFDSRIISIVKKGDRLFGSASVNCARCDEGRTYIVFLRFGEGGWYALVNDLRSGEVLTPKYFDRKTRAQAFQDLENLVPNDKRIAIKTP